MQIPRNIPSSIDLADFAYHVYDTGAGMIGAAVELAVVLLQ